MVKKNRSGILQGSGKGKEGGIGRARASRKRIGVVKTGRSGGGGPKKKKGTLYSEIQHILNWPRSKEKERKGGLEKGGLIEKERKNFGKGRKSSGTGAKDTP